MELFTEVQDLLLQSPVLAPDGGLKSKQAWRNIEKLEEGTGEGRLVLSFLFNIISWELKGIKKLQSSISTVHPKKCMSEVVRIGSIIIFRLSKL